MPGEVIWPATLSPCPMGGKKRKVIKKKLRLLPGGGERLNRRAIGADKNQSRSSSRCTELAIKGFREKIHHRRRKGYSDLTLVPLGSHSRTKRARKDRKQKKERKSGEKRAGSDCRGTCPASFDLDQILGGVWGGGGRCQQNLAKKKRTPVAGSLTKRRGRENITAQIVQKDSSRSEEGGGGVWGKKILASSPSVSGQGGWAEKRTYGRPPKRSSTDGSGGGERGGMEPTGPSEHGDQDRGGHFVCFSTGDSGL